jgi:ribosome-binding ATPase YchF (GTP1/OBG family)
MRVLAVLIVALVLANEATAISTTRRLSKMLKSKSRLHDEPEKPEGTTDIMSFDEDWVVENCAGKNKETEDPRCEQVKKNIEEAKSKVKDAEADIESEEEVDEGEETNETSLNMWVAINCMNIPKKDMNPKCSQVEALQAREEWIALHCSEELEASEKAKECEEAQINFAKTKKALLGDELIIKNE